MLREDELMYELILTVGIKLSVKLTAFISCLSVTSKYGGVVQGP